MKQRGAVLILGIQVACIAASNESNILTSIFESMGWREMVLICQDPTSSDCMSLIKTSMGSGSRVSLTEDSYATRFSHKVLLSPPVESAILHINKADVPYSVMIIESEKIADQEEHVTRIVQQIKPRVKGSRAFFIACAKLICIYVIHCFKNSQCIINKWKFQPNGALEEEYDMMGAELKTIGLPYPPYLGVGDCKNGNMNCKTYGSVPDILDEISSMFNFTWTCDREPDGDWGDESANKSLVSGVIGHIIREEYDLSPVNWLHTTERASRFDFTEEIGHVDFLAMINLKSKVQNQYLIIDPFATSSLSASALVVVCFAGIMSLMKFLEVKDWLNQDSQSKMIIIFSGWLFFVLIHSFFGAALTMFLSSPPDLPFTSINGGLTRFPEWKMISVRGTREKEVLRASKICIISIALS